MNVEIQKLEAKLAELRSELASTKTLMGSNRAAMGRSVTLCEHIAECERMLATARVLDGKKGVNNFPKT